MPAPMAELLDEKTLSQAQLQVYERVKCNYLRTERVAPNLIVSLDGLDNSELIRIRSIIDKNPRTCQFV